jgi:hypothetical protein
MTLLTNVFGNGVYFATNEGLRLKLGDYENFGLASTSVELLAGGVTGVVFRASIYPFDVVKARLMAEGTPEWVRARDAARAVVAEHGLAGFVRGLSPVLARAFLINAVGWAMLRSAQRRLGTAGSGAEGFGPAGARDEPSRRADPLRRSVGSAPPMSSQSRVGKGVAQTTRRRNFNSTCWSRDTGLARGGPLGLRLVAASVAPTRERPRRTRGGAQLRP